MITERCYRRPRRFRLLIGCLDPSTNSFRDARWNFQIREWTQRNEEQFNKHIYCTLRQARSLQLYNNSDMYTVKARNRKRTQSYNRLESYYTRTLIQFYFTRRRHHMHLHKSKAKSHPHRQGWQTGPWTKCARNLEERPGPRDRRVLPAPSWRDGGQAAMSA